MKQRLNHIYRLIVTNKLRSLLFVLGILVLLFPIVSQVSYYLASHQKINQFEHQAARIDRSAITKRIALAKAYNDAISRHPSLSDPFTSKEKAGLREYARMLEVNEQIGHVAIPKIGVDLPLYAGTSAAVLEKGSGHLEGTSLPIGGKTTHAVLTAHRGLPTARLFTDLDKVKKGDYFYVTNIKETLAYQVDRIIVIDSSQLDAVSIEEGKDYVTLLTCTPYMINSHRLLIRGVRIPISSKQAQKERSVRMTSYPYYRWVVYLAIAVFLILVMVLTKYYLKKKITL
ncbi:TPA: class C sortase [Streptococcus pyogenes]|nr:class C sortase [Streptococcus pyogenes]HEP6141601.1 class C sortase [Streptococcus pyogenes]HEQ9298278.1 class C sortase [Streptococcus pyogenes]HEX0027158.1 class C sortase [Streptococcus pyogenes]